MCVRDTYKIQNTRTVVLNLGAVVALQGVFGPPKIVYKMKCAFIFPVESREYDFEAQRHISS
jgi:hypothetical protein